MYGPPEGRRRLGSARGSDGVRLGRGRGPGWIHAPAAAQARSTANDFVTDNCPKGNR